MKLSSATLLAFSTTLFCLHAPQAIAGFSYTTSLSGMGITDNSLTLGGQLTLQASSSSQGPIFVGSGNNVTAFVQILNQTSNMMGVAFSSGAQPTIVVVISDGSGDSGGITVLDNAVGFGMTNNDFGILEQFHGMSPDVFQIGLATFTLEGYAEDLVTLPSDSVNFAGNGMLQVPMYAVFDVVGLPASVPEPASILLVGAGLAGAAAFGANKHGRRRIRRSA